MRKLQNFSVIQILREIKIGEFGVSKSTILLHSKALNCDIYAFLHFWEIEIYQINKIQSLYIGESDSFRTSKFYKIDFT